MPFEPCRYLRYKELFTPELVAASEEGERHSCRSQRLVQSHAQGGRPGRLPGFDDCLQQTRADLLPLLPRAALRREQLIAEDLLEFNHQSDVTATNDVSEPARFTCDGALFIPSWPGRRR